MVETRADELRRMLEAIDARLLAALTDAAELDDGRLAQVATLETARGAVLRLLAEQAAGA